MRAWHFSLMESAFICNQYKAVSPSSCTILRCCICKVHHEAESLHAAFDRAASKTRSPWHQMWQDERPWHGHVQPLVATFTLLAASHSDRCLNF